MIGISEDLGLAMSPFKRLMASILSGILVVGLYGIWLKHIAVPGLDLLLSFVPIGIAFTLFATSGVVNAFNLVDGINGLSSYITISISIALSIIAFEVDFFSLSVFMSLIVSIVLGFDNKFSFGKDIFRRRRCLHIGSYFSLVIHNASKF